MSIHSDFFNPLLDQMMAEEPRELLVHAGSRPYLSILTPDGMDAKPLENSASISPETLIPVLDSLKSETGATTGTHRHDGHRFRWSISGDTISFRYIPSQEDIGKSLELGKALAGLYHTERHVLFIGSQHKTSPEESKDD